jgi:hypothetical protein
MVKVGWNALTTDDPFNLQGKQTQYLDDMFAEKEKKKAEQVKREQQARSVQSTFMSGFKSDFQTKSPSKRVVIANQVDEATKQYSSLYDTIDSMDGIEFTKTNQQLVDAGDPIAKYLGAGSMFSTKEEYKRYLESEVIPAQQELLRRQSKYLDE